ncbi:MAG: hypothetical protein IT269_02205, partial [Saprospiraceae bacterium]|nr:hypothetical protein [Saprospiraceae bacterium]
MKFQSFLALAITVLAFFTESCQNPAPAPQQQPASDASSILSHRYWVSKPFHDALFNANVADTLGNISCSELIFASKDTVIFTSCLSDAGIGIVKSTGANTLEIMTEGFDNQPSKLEYNPATGILHFTPPAGVEGWPSEFVAQDGIEVNDLDNVTLNLGRKRLAGKYNGVSKGAEGKQIMLNVDGTQNGLGDYVKYEPWLSGI